jgi:hypothetical protein
MAGWAAEMAGGAAEMAGWDSRPYLTQQARIM